MAVTAKSLGIDRLSVEERIDLIEDIWVGICADNNASGMTPEQSAELDRRIADYDAHPENVISLDEFEAAARTRLAR